MKLKYVCAIAMCLGSTVFGKEENQNNKTIYSSWKDGITFFNSPEKDEEKRSVTVRTDSPLADIAIALTEYENKASCFAVQSFAYGRSMDEVIVDFLQQLEKCNEQAQSPVFTSRLVYLSTKDVYDNWPLYKQVLAAHLGAYKDNIHYSCKHFQYLPRSIIVLAIDKYHVTLDRNTHDTF